MANIDAWIISFPPVYTDLDLTTPAYSYFVYEEPSAAILQQIIDDGGTVRHIVVPDTFNNVEPDVTINGASVAVTDNGGGEYEFDHPEDNAQDITITLDDGAGGTISIPEFTYYNSYIYLLGDPAAGSDPRFFDKSEYKVYKISGSDGSTLSSTALPLSVDHGSLHVSNDGQYAYYTNATAKTAYAIWPNATLHTMYTAPSVAVFVTYDRVNDIVYIAPYTKGVVIRIHTKDGTYSSSITDPNSSLYYAGIAVHGTTSAVVKYTNTGIDSLDIYNLSGGLVYQIPKKASNVSGFPIVRAYDGYIYVLYRTSSSGTYLTKVNSAGTLQWEHSFTGWADDYASLDINDDHDVVVVAYNGATYMAYRLNSAGTETLSQSTLLFAIDNSGNLYGN